MVVIRQMPKETAGSRSQDRLLVDIYPISLEKCGVEYSVESKEECYLCRFVVLVLVVIHHQARRSFRSLASSMQFA